MLIAYHIVCYYLSLFISVTIYEVAMKCVMCVCVCVYVCVCVCVPSYVLYLTFLFSSVHVFSHLCIAP